MIAKTPGVTGRQNRPVRLWGAWLFLWCIVFLERMAQVASSQALAAKPVQFAGLIRREARKCHCASFSLRCRVGTTGERTAQEDAGRTPLGLMTTANGGRMTLSRPFLLQGYIKQKAILLLSWRNHQYPPLLVEPVCFQSTRSW